MRRRQVYAAQREAALRAEHLGPSEPIPFLPDPVDFSGGSLVIQKPVACKCPYCEREFATEQGLKIHKGRSHQ